MNRIAQIREVDIRAEVRRQLRLSGWFVYINVAHALSHKGLADMTAIKDGRTVWIETKSKTGTQSDRQIRFQHEIESHGGEYIVARSTDDVAHLCPDTLFFAP
jgi:hypothetical protein